MIRLRKHRRTDPSDLFLINQKITLIRSTVKRTRDKFKINQELIRVIIRNLSLSNSLKITQTLQVNPPFEQSFLHPISFVQTVLCNHGLS